MIIINLDGTISDDKWRERKINLNMSDMSRYHEYNLLAGFDDVGNEHLFRGKDIIVFTSRYNFYSAITFEWLRRNNIEPKILMFAPDNMRISHQDLRRQQLTMLFRNDSDIMPEMITTAYDNRHEVCTMYRKEGLHAEQVLNITKKGIIDVARSNLN